jgi:hypothetical protein
MTPREKAMELARMKALGEAEAEVKRLRAEVERLKAIHCAGCHLGQACPGRGGDRG